MDAFLFNREIRLGNGWRRFPLKIASRRLESLRLSNRHHFGFRENGLSAMLSVDVDSAERQFLLCGSNNGAVAVVDMNKEVPSTSTSVQCITLKVETAKRGRGSHKYAVTSCQWYPLDSSVFVSASVDKKVKLWDANAFSVVETFPFEEQIKNVHWSPHGGCTEIAVGLESSNISFIDIRSGDSAQELRWKDTVNSVQFSPSNPNILASGGVHGTISIWDKRSGKSELHTFRPSVFTKHQPSIGGLKFSSEGLYLVAVDLSAAVHVYSTPNYAHIGSERLHFDSEERKRFGMNGVVRFDVSSDVGDLWAFIPGGLSVYPMKLVELDRSNKLSGKVYRLQGSMTTLNACVYRPFYNQVIAVSKDGSGLLFYPQKDDNTEDSEHRRIEALTEDTWSDDD